MPGPSTPNSPTSDPDLPVFDDAHLDHQTMGDEDLRVEILALFASEVERLLIQAERARDEAMLGERLHAIKGLARNVGALRLRHVATGLESDCRAGPADLAPLRHAVMEAIEFLHSDAG
jgi:HPt (histidine-containing phosphotransfer) domain-containing protein